MRARRLEYERSMIQGRIRDTGLTIAVLQALSAQNCLGRRWGELDGINGLNADGSATRSLAKT